MNNYSSVLDQMRAYGLLPRLPLVIGKIQRCPVDGDREKRGSYSLIEVINQSGESMLIGWYGQWQGANFDLQKIQFEKTEFTKEQQDAFKKRIADERKRNEQEAERRADQASKKADHIWRNKLSPDGHCDYLARKNIPAIGVRFSEKNSMAIPMQDINGRIHGLQIILDREHNQDRIKKIGRDKEFFPTGMAKKGKFFLIGIPSNILLVAEGYATGATLHAATGLPVAIAFDAGNIDPVIEALTKKYRQTHILICADNDSLAKCPHCQGAIDLTAHPKDCPHCQQTHNRKNAGIDYATNAALRHGCAWTAPLFTDETARLAHFTAQKGKLTDYNDLQQTDGLHTVRIQIEAALNQQGWRITAARAAQTQGGGDVKKAALKPIDSPEELIARYALVYGMGGMLYDAQEHMRVAINDMKQACVHSEIPKRWQESKQRRIVRAEEVGFDPTEKNKDITCNTWGGWPTTPRQGKCDALLELLYYLCTGEQNAKQVYQWILRWLAYPIQHPGAKMKTCLVVHGPQGTGKNLFFDCVLAIYERYGRIIDQSAIEDKFNDCFSGKLFMLADEVVARSDLYHVKNKLKGLVSGDRIRINPKNMAAYEETNHVNLVFMSNERMPVVLEEDDRRHQVMWTPAKLDAHFYEEVAAEIANGGIEALHYELLHLDLGDFNPHTKPIMTQAKQDLILLGKDNISRFYDDWNANEIPGVNAMPALSDDVYTLYNYWCRNEGVKAAPKNKLIDAIAKKPNADKRRKRYFTNQGMTDNPRTIIYPANAQQDPPVGKQESYWLGDCINDFKLAINAYNGASHV